MKTASNRLFGLFAGCLALFFGAAVAVAWEPSDKDLDAAIARGDFSAYFVNLNTWLQAKTPGDLSKTDEKALAALVKDPAVRKALDQRQFLVTHGVEKVGAFAKDKTHQAFLSWALKSTEVLDTYLEAIASNDGLIADGSVAPGALERWQQLYAEDADTRQGVYMRLAMAVALCPPRGTGMYSGEPIDWHKRYLNYKRANEKKDLMPSFNHLLVVDYEKVVNCIGGDRDIDWARQMINTWRPDLREKEQVNKIVSEVWRRFSPFPFDNGFITVMEGGGKCGPRGIFGQFVCNALGIPAIGVGQPAHCCFAARCDFPETEPQVSSVWKVYQGRGWQYSDCGGNMYGPQFVAEMTKRYRTAELSAICHIQWLASAQGDKGKTDAMRILALKIRQPIDTNHPYGVPAWAVDVEIAGKRFKVDPLHKEPLLDYDKEGPGASNDASIAVVPKVKEEPIVVPPGVIHVKAESFVKSFVESIYPSDKAAKVGVFDCYTGGKQIYFPRSMKTTWVEYALDVPEAGTYQMEIMLAAANRNQVLDVSSGGETLGTIKIPGTIGLWKKMEPIDIRLAKGSQTLRISAPSQRGVSIRWFELTPKK